MKSELIHDKPESRQTQFLCPIRPGSCEIPEKSITPVPDRNLTSLAWSEDEDMVSIIDQNLDTKSFCIKVLINDHSLLSTNVDHIDN